MPAFRCYRANCGSPDLASVMKIVHKKMGPILRTLPDFTKYNEPCSLGADRLLGATMRKLFRFSGPSIAARKSFSII